MNNKTTRKIISWDKKFLNQTHTTSKPILITSGCSFTDSSATSASIDMPISWPGYVKERCKFDYVIDVSSSGNGNDYISTSIVNLIESMSADDIKRCIVLIVWSGIDRRELPTYDPDYNPTLPGGSIDGVRFIRESGSVRQVNDNIARGEALRSWKNIIMTQHYLENKNIPFGFGFYVNVFDPPFLPRVDQTIEFFGRLDPLKIKQLKNCNWIHQPNESLFEWAFYQEENMFNLDGFHLNPNGYLGWTDNVLLPNLVKMGVISPVDQ
jgi:hypothetical protein